MTLQKTECGYIVECNHCGAELEIEAVDFDDFLDGLENEEWQSKKINNIWLHFCPDCRQDRGL